MSKIIATDYQDMYGETIHVGDIIRNQRDGRTYRVNSSTEARTADGCPLQLSRAHTQRDFLITRSAEQAEPAKPSEPQPELTDPGLPRFNFSDAAKEKALDRRGRPRGGVLTPRDCDDPIFQGTKVCATCGQTLLRTNFYRNAGSVDGLRSTCIYCVRAQARNRYRETFAKN